MSFTRRDFLRGGLASAALCAWPACSESERPEAAPSKRVIVVGAGLAGLSCALDLKEKGHDVVVLEARERIGGRVHTVRDPFPGKLYVEAGAMWVPETHRTVRRYVDRFRLKLIPARAPEDVRSLTYRYHIRETDIDLSPEGIKTTHFGQPCPMPLRFRDEERDLGFSGMREHFVYEPARALGDPRSADWASPETLALDDLTFAEYLRRRGISDDALAFLRLGLYDDWGDGCDHISALCVLRDAAHLQRDDIEWFVLSGGMMHLPHVIERELGDRVRLGAPVERIEHDGEEARVVVVRDGARETLRADYVVCTAPFSVLDRITFSPALSGGKARAAKELPYTSINRQYLLMKERYWRELGLFGDSITDLPFQALVHATLRQPGARGVMSTYTAAAAARRIAAMPESKRLDYILEHIELVFPGARKHLESAPLFVDWDQDPWARGAFVWFRPGQMKRHLGHLATPEGRIHFAGEHTSTCPGWMEGALESGERAAAEVDRA